MLIKIIDQNDDGIYFSLYVPDPYTYQQMLSGKFNLFIGGTPSSAPPRDLLYLDPPYGDSETTPYMGWARIHPGTEHLQHYLGGQETNAYPLVYLHDFKVTLEEGRTHDTGTGWTNRAKNIGPEITWELQP